jgi:glyoxylase-like metal-dependent hydrolase (beta-lactamase superfamily II)
MSHPDRRALLKGSALAALAGVMPAIGARPGRAAAPPSGQQAPGYYRFRLGDFEITAINDGVWNRPMGERFVHNASRAEVRRAITSAFIPLRPTLPLSITALVVNTGSKLVLIDTGSAGQVADTAGTLMRNLAAAGLAPETIDAILISHFHPDHIDGIKSKDDAVIFPKAEIMVPEREWAFWMDEATLNKSDKIRLYALNARRIFGNITKSITRFAPGRELAPGIHAIAAPGHTPGHAAFAVASGKQTLLVLGDIASHPALFVRHPRWRPGWDMDGQLAVETRLQLFDRAGADRLLVAGYHFPFPAIGHIARDGRNYEFVPAPWQPVP